MAEQANSAARTPIVDVHWHFVPPAYLAELERPDNRWGERVTRDEQGLTWLTSSGGVRLRPVMEGLYEPEAQIQELDRRGVDTAAASIPPMLFYEDAQPAKALDLHQMVNDTLADLAPTIPAASPRWRRRHCTRPNWRCRS